MTDRPATNWSSYWEGIEHGRIFAVEAGDHVARLRRAVALSPGDRVLDFGCGFGHVAALIAPLVAEVRVWDASERMRRATAARTAGLDNVAPVDLSAATPDPGFDLVLANSVVQYMEREELAGWVRRWAAMLRAGGRVVVSDIPVPDGPAASELLAMLGFVARHGFLGRALREGVAEVVRYARSRGAARLLRLTPSDVTAMAAQAGLVATILPVNLTHRAGRLTAVLAVGQLGQTAPKSITDIDPDR